MDRPYKGGMGSLGKDDPKNAFFRDRPIIQNKKGGSEKPPSKVHKIRSDKSAQLPRHRKSKIRNEI